MMVAIAPSWLSGSWTPKSFNAVMRFLPTYHVNELINVARGDAPTVGVGVSIAILLACIAALFFGVVYVLRRMTA